jgi:hypothetical protein
MRALELELSEYRSIRNRIDESFGKVTTPPSKGRNCCIRFHNFIRNNDPAVDGEDLTLLLHSSTDRMFTKLSDGAARLRCLKLIFCSLLFLPLTPAVLIRSLYLLAKVRSWDDLGLALLRLFLSPIFALLFLLACIYGIFRPQQGRSVYGALERLFFPSNYYPIRCFLPTRYCGVVIATSCLCVYFHGKYPIYKDKDKGARCARRAFNLLNAPDPSMTYEWEFGEKSLTRTSVEQHPIIIQWEKE